MKKRLLLSSIIVIALAGCQTFEGSHNRGSAQSASLAQQTAPTLSEDIWVDLTPYPKERNSAMNKNETLDEQADINATGPIASWGVRLSDGTIRQALSRWAGEAGWSFNSTNYELDVDIPITAEATLVQRGTFKQGVQALVEAVGLSDHPIRACFYQNNVLRIIGYNSSCNSRSN